MKSSIIGLLTALAWASSALASLESDVDTLSRSTCLHSATDRGCWDGVHDIDTNWYEEIFYTGVVREYWLEVTNTTVAPDGYERQVLVFNNTLPGPEITADWGDEIIVHVTNQLQDNGTAIHWHGIRQLNTSEFDGVPGVTQCPISPGGEMTYRFHASQYGTTWYHSHFSLQYADGLLGAIIINGPSSANFDEDLGMVFLSDWDHKTAFQSWKTDSDAGFDPELENVLINYKNVWDCSNSAVNDPACLGTGVREEFVFEQGKSYKLRLINTAIDGWFEFSMDNHTFEVIAADLVPIVPYATSSLSISMGQRYDIIVTANATAGDYWMRAGWVNYCATNVMYADDFAIIRYDESSTTLPRSVAQQEVAASCADEDVSHLVPWVPITVGEASLGSVIGVNYYLTDNFNRWYFNNSTFWLNWSNPTTLMAYKGEAVFPADINVYPITQVDEWVYWVITDDTGFEVVWHPIHMHGHDFYVVAQTASEAFDPATVVLNLDNPLRRDVASLPGGGYLVIAFKSDNPGTWLLHCHIAWHSSQGLALQFVEREDEIGASITKGDDAAKQCAAWDEYYPSTIWKQDDSGV